MEIIWLLNSSSVPDISLLRIHSPISLPARVAAVSGGARMSNGRRWCSPSSWSIRHGHLPALITVTDLSTIAVSQLCARWRWWLCSSHGFKVFWIAVEPWTFSARSRAIFLWIRFIVKAVASAKKKKFIGCCSFTTWANSEIWQVYSLEWKCLWKISLFFLSYFCFCDCLPIKVVGLPGWCLWVSVPVSGVEIIKTILLSAIVVSSLTDPTLWLCLHLFTTIPVWVFPPAHTEMEKLLTILNHRDH